jgi:cysteine desulfurase
MDESPVYLDHHATTPVDSRVLSAMLPYFSERFGNAGSSGHAYGWQARDAVDAARDAIAKALNASPREIVFTSGATESNNLALRGVGERPRRKGNHLISVVSEHKAVLDPIAKLARRGFAVTLLPVQNQEHPTAGRIDLDQLTDAIRADTLLVSVMLANNEIGVIQPLREICRICKSRGVLVHTDAAQAVGRIAVDVADLDVDLLSFSAHKMYGPKGVGGLYVRGRGSPVRLEAQIDGGRQEAGRRSGTLDVPGIVGMAKALELSMQDMQAEAERERELRNRFFADLTREVEQVQLNGPALEDPRLRLPNNLNCSFSGVDGEALMMTMRGLAVSSGSACTSADPAPSHVLRALGLSEERTRSSLRFGLGRGNTASDIQYAVRTLAEAVRRLRGMRESCRLIATVNANGRFPDAQFLPLQRVEP